MPGASWTKDPNGYVPWGPAQHHTLDGEAPWDWSGTAALDGTATLFKDAPLGSRYAAVVGSGTVTQYIKTANTNNTSADWGTVTLT